MSYEDFIRHFTAVNVCKTKSCNEVRLKGKFVRLSENGKPTADVISKWFYCVDIQKKAHMNLGLH